MLFPILAAACVLISGLGGGPREFAGMIGGGIAMVLAMLTIFALFGVAVYRSALEAPKDRPCEACGEVIAVVVTEGPKVCPRCRVRHMSAEQARKEQAKGCGLLVVLMVILAVFGAMTLRPTAGVASAGDSLIQLPLSILKFMGLGAAACFIVLVFRQVARQRRLRSDRGAIAAARRSAGEEGEVVRAGNSIIWYSGGYDPTPMIGAQTALARRRFEAMTGLAVADAPLRALVFHDRGAFLRFHRRLYPGIDFASFDGLYWLGVRRLCTLCTAPAPCRVSDVERTTRSMAAHALMESVWGPRTPAWLQNGIIRCASAAGDADASARLNRKMAASLAAGTAISAEIFRMSQNELLRLMRGSKDSSKYQRMQQFSYQAASIVEFLCDGPPAEGAERNRLGAFLTDPLSKSRPEDSLRRHFGRDFATLLDEWRHRVVGREPGAHEPPPPHIRAALLERVLPVIRDRGARLGDRILAIRDWAGEGHVLGADALIDLLREPGEIPREEIIWALRMASGLAWGDEPERWQAWWDDLPMEWKEPRHPPHPKPEGFEVAT